MEANQNAFARAAAQCETCDHFLQCSVSPPVRLASFFAIEPTEVERGFCRLAPQGGRVVGGPLKDIE